jgi:hypothetical protein
MRRSTVFFGYLAFSAVLLISAFTHAASERARLGYTIEMKKQLVRDLSLTDLCLFTEARYTRHPSQADLHTAFQDHLLSFEHFPSGSLLPPRDRRIAP